MTWIGKLWTAGIAYVALAVGAGLSIMYNVVDTAAVRGSAMDIYDLVTAIAAPGIVVLMVELFVSNWWVGTYWPMQVLRWSGCLVIGGVAMRASWTHGHDFMIGRGQTADVATTWPLAIDLLAVMATALILAGRRVRGHVPVNVRGHVSAVMDTLATGERMSADTLSTVVSEIATDIGKLQAQVADMSTSGHTAATPSGWTGAVASEADVADSEAAFRGQVSADTPNVNGHDRWTDLVDADAVHSADIANLMSWADGARRADIAEGLATEASAYLSAMTVGELPKRTRPAGSPCPPEFADMVSAWQPDQLPRADLVKLSAAYFGVSTRSASRWLARLNNEPVSGPPSDEEADQDG